MFAGPCEIWLDAERHAALKGGSVGRPDPANVTRLTVLPPCVDALFVFDRSQNVETSRIVDLSVPLESGMTVFPGDPEAEIGPALAISRGDAVNVLSLHIGSHSGTHIDAPYHVLEDGPRLDELPLERFLGPAVVADVRHLNPEDPIEWEDLAPAHGYLRSGAILLLHTGWSRHWLSPSRYRTPSMAHLACGRIHRGCRRAHRWDRCAERRCHAGGPLNGTL